jgi:hypothetical protein
MLAGIVLGRYFGEKNKDGRNLRARLVVILLADG